ncbi:RodZ family helix-turn-helix domain-containing protein, partial [Paenibacillus sp. P22]|uniref:helix-turn-helix domain-containing protein n=3 Tax=Paenibacillus TaxID=44249 RepID=UPI00039033BC
MSELGQTLRTAREEMGLSLDQVQEMTKIRKHYLTAIEEGNYAALPGSFYARAFVKNYAEAVGLNADELLNYYKNELPAAPAASAVEPAAAPQ